MKSTKISNSIIENFKQTLSAYLSELTSENISLISESIIKNYINHKSNIESRKIYDILLIYSKKEVRTIVLLGVTQGILFPFCFFITSEGFFSACIKCKKDTSDIDTLDRADSELSTDVLNLSLDDTNP